MGNFGGGFPQQNHHRRSEVYLPSTTPDLFFIIVLAYRPVVYEAVLCQLKHNVTVGLDCPPQAETCFECQSIVDVEDLTTRVIQS